MPTFTAADVPGRIDVLLSGQGYLLSDQVSSPVASAYGLQRATFGYSPTFVQRQNVQGDYGDSQQDFWLTFTQRDWSLGEGLRYARGNDEDKARRYWAGAAVDPVKTQGQVSMRPGITSLSGAAAYTAIGGSIGQNLVFGTTSTTLYEINSSGTITSRGAHGVGVSPTCLAADPEFVYMSAGGGNVRRWSGAAFSTFSASGADALAYLNNALYGFRFTTGDLVRWDSAGTLTSLYIWKNSLGNAPLRAGTVLEPYGGDLLILLVDKGPAELWLYDGVAPAKIAALPHNFLAFDMTVAEGTVFISGSIQHGTTYYPAVLFYANGSLGELWRATSAGVGSGIANVSPGILFHDNTTSTLNLYDASNGGIHTLAGSLTGARAWLTSTGTFSVLFDVNSTPGSLWPSSTYATTATVTSALVDFDSSLNKLFRGVRIDFDSATDGNGGSLDIAYRLNDVDAGYTNLQTGAASGTEYTLTNITGRSISIKVTINKGTSTNGPVLKRISLRAAPIMPVYRRRSYTFMLSGRDGKSPVTLRDGSPHSKDGKDMATDLATVAALTTPFSVTDHLGTFTAVLEPDGIKLVEFKPEQWVAHVDVREV